jgi:hypothetical protein
MNVCVFAFQFFMFFISNGIDHLPFGAMLNLEITGFFSREFNMFAKKAPGSK